MNRKLHNTVTALFATSGLLALSMVIARPVEVSPAPQALPLAIETGRLQAVARGLEAQATTLDQQLQGDASMPGLAAGAATLEAVAGALGEPAAPGTSGSPVRRSHRSRQSVAMPFFSFFPRG